MSLDYSLCCQTVTLYGLRNGVVTRRVLENVLYTWQVIQVTDETGTRQETTFLLVLPGVVELQPGDRVLEGVGPEITADQWPEFLPVTVWGLAQVQYVKPYYWQGKPCHIEAGRK